MTKTLEPGTRIHFVALHLDKTAAEIIEAGKSEGHELTRGYVHTTKSILKTKYGITKPILTDQGASQYARATSAPPPARKSRAAKKKGKPKRAAAAKPMKRKFAKRANGAADERAPVMHPKQAELRRLIFEMGFDAARTVFAEFSQMHERMQSP